MPFVVPRKLEWEDYGRLVVFVIACVYLAWPVVRVLAVRVWAFVRSEFRGGSSWRF